MAALFVAAMIVPGIHVNGNWVAYAIMAALLALLNTTLLPILKALSCGMIILTLGFFSLVLNAMMFMLSSWLAQNLFNVNFVVDGFGLHCWVLSSSASPPCSLLAAIRVTNAGTTTNSKSDLDRT
ncbi:MAG: phage holin family protein [Ignavibacteriales bacterium]|nr:phage holin family protein [Ignavibacteriales bacterium]